MGPGEVTVIVITAKADIKMTVMQRIWTICIFKKTTTSESTRRTRTSAKADLDDFLHLLETE